LELGKEKLLLLKQARYSEGRRGDLARISLGTFGVPEAPAGRVAKDGSMSKLGRGNMIS
jgi:hypothetical protein